MQAEIVPRSRQPCGGLVTSRTTDAGDMNGRVKVFGKSLCEGRSLLFRAKAVAGDVQERHVVKARLVCT